MKNDQKAQKDVTVIFAYYDGEGRLDPDFDMKTVPVTGDGELVPVTATLENLSPVADSYVKLFIWEGFTTLKPLETQRELPYT